MRKITLILLVMLSTSFSSTNVNYTNNNMVYKELLYDNVWGTIYNAEVRQCDNSPLETGDGSHIDPNNASEHRWIAITHNMLDDKWRRTLIDSSDTRFNGRISYGDTVWIESPYDQLNGWWVVRDTKNKRYTEPTIDFLQTMGDKSLYKDNPRWSGKWNNIKIYKYYGNNSI